MITPVLVDAPGGKITTSCFAQILQYLSSIEGELGYFCITFIYCLKIIISTPFSQQYHYDEIRE
jgi:hypothetical protein